MFSIITQLVEADMEEELLYSIISVLGIVSSHLEPIMLQYLFKLRGWVERTESKVG